MDFRKRLGYGLIVICVALLSACAIISPPTGGEKDTTPPKLIKALPENYSVHFTAKKIRLTFNEYVTFNLQKTPLVVSPPLRKIPEVSIRGKSIILSFDDTLIENTTYTFNFGSTISDLNEGNEFKNFRYVFSTGSVIDSLSLKGFVNDALTGLPAKEITVMLYEPNDDSVVYHKRPMFAALTNESGFFRFDNLPEKNFKILALKDGNSNYLYDLATEKIGFIDTLVKPFYLLADTSVKKSSVKDITIDIFQEKDSIQRLMKFFQPYKGMGVLYFAYPLETIHLKPLYMNPKWEPIIEYNSSRDSIQFWYKPIAEDTLSVELLVNGRPTDTLLIDQKKNSKSGKNAFEKQKLSFSSNVQSEWLNHKDTLTILFASPIDSIKEGKILLFQDSSLIEPKFIVWQRNSRNLKILYPWKENTNYSFLIKDSLVQDLFGRFNDSLKVRFRVKPPEMYGTIALNVKPEKTEGPFVLQLLNKSGQVLDQKTVVQAQIVKFERLNPGEYSFKIIVDKNNNQKWDSGVFIKKKHPEKVLNLPGVITVRANWDSEVDWSF